jgi:hypothetical protein
MYTIYDIPLDIGQAIELDAERDSIDDVFARLSIVHSEQQLAYMRIKKACSQTTVSLSSSISNSLWSTLEQFRLYIQRIENVMLQLDSSTYRDVGDNTTGKCRMIDSGLHTSQSSCDSSCRRDLMTRCLDFITDLLKEVDQLQINSLSEEQISLMVVTRTCDSTENTFRQEATSYFPVPGNDTIVHDGSTHVTVLSDFIAVFMQASREKTIDDLILHRYYKHNRLDQLEKLRDTFVIDMPEQYPLIQTYREAGARYASGHFRDVTALTIRVPVGVSRDRGGWSIPSNRYRSLHLIKRSNARMVIVENTNDYRLIRVRLAMPREGMYAFTDVNYFTMHCDHYPNTVVTMSMNKQGLYVPLHDYTQGEHGVIIRKEDRLSIHHTPSMMDAVHRSKNRY